VTIAQLASDSFVTLPPHEGSVLTDRLHRLAHDAGFVADVVQIAPDTQTAIALVSAEVGCHLTLMSVSRNVTDPHVAFVPVRATEGELDVHLRAAWRRRDDNPALRGVLRYLSEAGTSDET
jgi:DNA-binding transcriptional LysR family regulator